MRLAWHQERRRRGSHIATIERVDLVHEASRTHATQYPHASVSRYGLREDAGVRRGNSFPDGGRLARDEHDDQCQSKSASGHATNAHGRLVLMHSFKRLRDLDHIRQRRKALDGA